jgi:hypothetical protein
MRKVPFTLVCAAFLALCLSCSNPLDGQSSGGTGSVVFSISGSLGRQTRTIVPSIAADIESLDVVLSSGTDTYTRTVSSSTSSILFEDIPTGSYTLSVSALDDFGAVIGAGSSAVSVTLGVSQTVTVLITYGDSMETSGDLSIVLKWPASTEIDYLYWTLSSNSGELAEDAASVSVAAAFYTATLSSAGLAPGTYTLKMIFKKGGAAGTSAGVFIESVNIYAGQVSDGWVDSAGEVSAGWTFSTDDFFDSTTSITVTVEGADSYSLSSGTTSVNIDTINNEDFTFMVNGVNGQDIEYQWNGGTTGEASLGETLSGLDFVAGDNTLSISVTAPDGESTQDYTISMYCYTLAYAGNSETDGTVPSTLYGTAGRTVALDENTGTLERLHYEFHGWNTQASPTPGSGFIHYEAGASVTITGNLTLYAQWIDQDILDLDTSSSTWVVSGSLAAGDILALAALVQSAGTGITLDLSGATIESLSSSSFRACSNLVSIILPEGLETIGNDCFYQCTSLESITIPDSVTSLGSWSFFSCNSLVEVDLPDSLTTLAASCFNNCNALESITIPASVTTIGDYCFYYCSALETVTCLPTTPPSLGGTKVFKDCGALTKIYYPVGCSGYLTVWSNWGSYLTEAP